MLSFFVRDVAARPWEMVNGEYEEFLVDLDGYAGDNILFNCRVLVEKIKYSNKIIYWVSVFDNLKGASSALSFSSSAIRLNLVEGPNMYSLRKTIKNSVGKKTIFLHLQKDYNGNIVRLAYREFFSNPFLLTNNILCSNEY